MDDEFNWRLVTLMVSPTGHIDERLTVWVTEDEAFEHVYGYMDRYQGDEPPPENPIAPWKDEPPG